MEASSSPLHKRTWRTLGRVSGIRYVFEIPQISPPLFGSGRRKFEFNWKNFCFWNSIQVTWWNLKCIPQNFFEFQKHRRRRLKLSCGWFDDFWFQKHEEIYGCIFFKLLKPKIRFKKLKKLTMPQCWTSRTNKYKIWGFATVNQKACIVNQVGAS